jgi:AbrB family looped-hinge helix DNA binding protein
MKKAASRLTEKYQATIPLAVRKHLRLGRGDTVVFEIERDRVFVRRALPIDLAYATAVSDTLAEWDSPNDDDAYRDL